MSNPESLPWVLIDDDNLGEDYRSIATSETDPDYIARIWDDYAGSKQNAEYIIKAANMLPELLKALEAVTERYTSLINSGDCGNWDPEEEPEIMQVRELLAKVKED